MSKKDDLEWEEIKREHIVNDKWIDFRSSVYRFPDGKEFGPYYSYSRRDYCVIVATDEDGNYICVRQYRYGIKEVTTEFPAGGIERTGEADYRKGEGDTSTGEEAMKTAMRELSEETGYESDEWTHLMTVPSNATIADNYAYIFKAANCRKVSGQDLDDTEYLNVVLKTPEEVESLIRQGEFQQAMHILAWYLAGEGK